MILRYMTKHMNSLKEHQVFVIDMEIDLICDTLSIETSDYVRSTLYGVQFEVGTADKFQNASVWHY